MEHSLVTAASLYIAAQTTVFETVPRCTESMCIPTLDCTLVADSAHAGRSNVATGVDSNADLERYHNNNGM